MNQENTMQAIAMDQFGGPEKLKLQIIPTPSIEDGEVLIKVEIAGVGEWDPFEREGGFAEMFGTKPSFPYILGSEGAGTVAAVGEGVDDFKKGDRVYGSSFLNPKGGFYAQYAVVKADLVRPIPKGLSIEQAGVMSGVGLTALRGLEDTLDLKSGESILVFGASGGVGMMAAQLAQQKGARVLAVASGEDGVALAKSFGVDAVVDGRTGDVLATAREFSPEGLDAAFIAAGGEAANLALTAVREGGRVCYPTGVEPEPQVRSGIQLLKFDGNPDRDILERLDRLIEAGPFGVHVARVFPLAKAAEAHNVLKEHHIGKFALKVD